MTCPMGKKGYPSPQAAYATVQHLKSDRRKKSGKSVKHRASELMNAYQCPTCREWHIGHRTPTLRAPLEVVP